MKVHDFHLRGYEVLDFGSTIVLDAVYDYPSQPKRETRVRFEGVELYSFSHTSGAILSDVEQVPVEEVLRDHARYIENAAKMHGIGGWRDGLEQYAKYLSEKSTLAWVLTSSIGFEGFIIALSVREMRV